MHINKINEKKYIGITCRDLNRRFGRNGSYYKESSVFWNAICKYGWENFDHVILYSGLTKDEACRKEIELIQEYQTQNREYGYNITDGGTSPNMAEETKRKISEKRKGAQFSEEHKTHLSEARKQRIVTEETKAKTSATMKGKPKTSGKNLKKVFCIELGRVFDTISQASKETGCCATNICSSCKKETRTAGGYHWRYYEA